MIDLFSLGLSHGLLLLAAWRILRRPDLDRAAPSPVRARPGMHRRPAEPHDA